MITLELRRQSVRDHVFLQQIQFHMPNNGSGVSGLCKWDASVSFQPNTFVTLPHETISLATCAICRTMDIGIDLVSFRFACKNCLPRRFMLKWSSLIKIPVAVSRTQCTHRQLRQWWVMSPMPQSLGHWQLEERWHKIEQKQTKQHNFKTIVIWKWNDCSHSLRYSRHRSNWILDQCRLVHSDVGIVNQSKPVRSHFRL